mmetsp:Transcript_21983/g.48923  ORF Transcript_21983/g.48923 Transcript_21983/m.48923 type:complete len:620 (+) Transcript_21983:193-2052(+)
MPTTARRRSGLRSQGFIPVTFFGSLLILLLCATIYTHNLASLTTDCSGATAESRIQQLRPLSNNVNLDDACDTEYKRLTHKQTPGITKDDLARSQAHLGNRFRLTEVMKALTARKRPVTIVVAGGSISLGHGVTPDSARYAERLESWMNQEYPLAPSLGHHRVLNVAAHGADMCAMAKRLNVLYSDLGSKLPKSSNDEPDLIILEFAVNDYQGQDHLITVDSKTTVFFDGFQDLVLCAEVVTHALLKRYQNSAISYLEFQTAIATRKTGALLHMGVAQHYDVPVISYAETMFPGFYRLKAELEKEDDKSYTFPQDRWLANGGLDQSSNVTSGVFSYPHGCSRCEAHHIIEQFRYGGCKSMCTFVERSGIIHGRLKCSSKQGQIPEGRNECFVPFLAHDAIHPSALGHQIAKDLVVHTLASAERSACKGESAPSREVLPLTTFVANSFRELDTRANWLVVYDVARIFSRWDKMNPVASSVQGFRLYADDKLKQRPGWIATSPEGSSSITFVLDLPADVNSCYTVYLAILRSYKGMGTFTVQVRDFGENREGQPKRVTTKDNIDGLWSSPISVWSDIQITPDNEKGCTGYCEVQITTDRKKDNREGNKVKLLTLSARSCTT